MVRLSAAALLCALCTITPTLAWVNKTNLVELDYASYQGFFNTTADVTFFLGIRYAEPPIGELRFQAPKPPSKMKDIQFADIPPPQCPQTSSGNAPLQPFQDIKPIEKRQSGLTEDCLFLNVFVPGTINPKKKLPVVVWIHGGGYVAGSAATFNGVDLINDADGGVVSVVIQYRLGVFGFLAGTEMKKNGALNAGLLDQNAALQWVQKYISNFGGDPDKVAIWGQSAGAGSVMQHMLAHGGKTNPPLFRVAMTSSTFLPSQYNYNDQIPEDLYAATVKATGCENAKSSFTCLQNVNVNILQTANVQIGASYFAGVFSYVPVVDGSFIIEPPSVTFKKGHSNGKTLFSNTNAFEGTLFVHEDITSNMTLPEYVINLFPTLNSKQVAQVADAYSNIGLVGTFPQAGGIMGESIFICPTYKILKVFPGHSFKSELAIPPAFHGEDVAFYFTSRGAPVYNNTAFQRSYAESFLAVVTHLNPNDVPDPSIVPEWATYNDNNTEMLFNITTAGQPDVRPIHTDSGLVQRCALWESLAPFIGQ